MAERLADRFQLLGVDLLQVCCLTTLHTSQLALQGTLQGALQDSALCLLASSSWNVTCTQVSCLQVTSSQACRTTRIVSMPMVPPPASCAYWYSYSYMSRDAMHVCLQAQLPKRQAPAEAIAEPALPKRLQRDHKGSVAFY